MSYIERGQYLYYTFETSDLYRQLYTEKYLSSKVHKKLAQKGSMHILLEDKSIGILSLGNEFSHSQAKPN